MKNTDFSGYVSNRRFGVEIELEGLIVSEANIVLENAGFLTWKAVYDSSVSRGAEVVSPPLCGAQGLREVAEVVELLRLAGAKTSPKCGLHVHVDAEDLSAFEMANVVYRYGKFEEEIDWFVPSARRKNEGYFCKSVKNYDFRSLVVSFAVLSKRSVANFQYGRYNKVNLQAYLKHGTIEFRQYGGTLNMNKIGAWVAFCTHFTDASKIGNNFSLSEFVETTRRTNTLAMPPHGNLFDNIPEFVRSYLGARAEGNKSREAKRQARQSSRNSYYHST